MLGAGDDRHGIDLLPALLIADEPTTAHVTCYPAQIPAFDGGLHAELGMAMLLDHPRSRAWSPTWLTVVVMYHGVRPRIGTLEDIFGAPQHPHLQALLSQSQRSAMAPGERLVPIREITPAEGKLVRSPGKPGRKRRTARAPRRRREPVPSRPTRSARAALSAARRRSLRSSAVEDASFEVRRGGVPGARGRIRGRLGDLLLPKLDPAGAQLPDHGSVQLFPTDYGKILDALTLSGNRLVDLRESHPARLPGPLLASLNPAG